VAGFALALATASPATWSNRRMTASAVGVSPSGYCGRSRSGSGSSSRFAIYVVEAAVLPTFIASNGSDDGWLPHPRTVRRNRRRACEPSLFDTLLFQGHRDGRLAGGRVGGRVGGAVGERVDAGGLEPFGAEVAAAVIGAGGPAMDVVGEIGAVESAVGLAVRDRVERDRNGAGVVAGVESDRDRVRVTVVRQRAIGMPFRSFSSGAANCAIHASAPAGATGGQATSRTRWESESSRMGECSGATPDGISRSADLAMRRGMRSLTDGPRWFR
jgi:hypothetical protein